MNIHEARSLLSKNNGWVQGPYNGVLLSTIGNSDERTIAAEQRQGWTLVAVFHGDEMVADTTAKGFPNRAVFQRPLPTCYSASDPWHDSGSWAWLPRLAVSKDEPAAASFLGVGGHGSPFVVRSFRCDCNGGSARIFLDEEGERYIVLCAECGRLSNVFSFEPFPLPDLGILVEQAWREVKCCCGSQQHVLHYGLEYSADSETGSDFTWIALAAECTACGGFAEVFSKETQ
jgi:hypothetical protein